MKNLSKNELLCIKGGGVGSWVLIGTGVVFLIGVIDGYIRPLRCN